MILYNSIMAIDINTVNHDLIVHIGQNYELLASNNQLKHQLVDLCQKVDSALE